MSDPGRDPRMLVTGGRVIDPRAGTVAAEDLLLDDGRIAARGPAGTVTAEAPVLDARGLLIFPGLVDMHVHLREPGQEYKETVATGVASALAGGFTSVACMANTSPVNDSGAVTRFILERAALAAGARVHPIGALSLGLKGERLAEIGEMHRAGIVAVSDDGRPVMDAALMRRALEYTQLFDLPVIAHDEDEALCCGGAMNEGPTALRLGLRGRNHPAHADSFLEPVRTVNTYRGIPTARRQLTQASIGALADPRDKRGVPPPSPPEGLKTTGVRQSARHPVRCRRVRKPQRPL